MKQPFELGLLFPEKSQSYQERLNNKRHIIRSFKSEADGKRSVFEKMADFLTQSFGSVTFLTLNLLIFTVWILINSKILPKLTVFDPYPFGFLTMAVSLEAIFLSIFVLISQNRASKTADLREEIDLQVNTIAEEEITKLMELTAILLKKNNVDLSSDNQLQEMLKPLNTQKIEEKLEGV